MGWGRRTIEPAFSLCSCCSCLPCPCLGSLSCCSPAYLDPSSRKPPWAAPGEVALFRCPWVCSTRPLSLGSQCLLGRNSPGLLLWPEPSAGPVCKMEGGTPPNLGLLPARGALSLCQSRALLPESCPGPVLLMGHGPHCPRPCPFQGAFCLPSSAGGLMIPWAQGRGTRNCPLSCEPPPPGEDLRVTARSEPGSGWCGPTPPWPVALSTWDLA